MPNHLDWLENLQYTVESSNNLGKFYDKIYEDCIVYTMQKAKADLNNICDIENQTHNIHECFKEYTLQNLVGSIEQTYDVSGPSNEEP